MLRSRRFRKTTLDEEDETSSTMSNRMSHILSWSAIQPDGQIDIDAAAAVKLGDDHCEPHALRADGIERGGSLFIGSLSDRLQMMKSITKAAEAAEKDPNASSSASQPPIRYITCFHPEFHDLPNDDEVNALWVPVDDHESVDIAQYFELATNFVLRCIENRVSLLIHCFAGVSRSVTTAMAAVVAIRLERKKTAANAQTDQEKHWITMEGLEEILFETARLIRQRREQAWPNSAFRTQIVEWALKRSGLRHEGEEEKNELIKRLELALDGGFNCRTADQEEDEEEVWCPRPVTVDVDTYFKLLPTDVDGTAGESGATVAAASAEDNEKVSTHIQQQRRQSVDECLAAYRAAMQDAPPPTDN